MMSAMLSAATCVFIALQVYHYLVYPLILAAVAAFERRRPPHAVRTPTVSLVTAAHNEQDVIRDKVENSLALDYPQLEIIFVSDGSTDRTDAILNSYVSHGVHFARLPLRSGKAAALSLASELATGDVLVVSDANAAVDRDAIKSLVRAFDDPRVGCVCGNLGVASLAAAASLGQSEGVYWRYEAFLRRGKAALGPTSHRQARCSQSAAASSRRCRRGPSTTISTWCFTFCGAGTVACSHPKRAHGGSRHGPPQTTQSAAGASWTAARSSSCGSAPGHGARPPLCSLCSRTSSCACSCRS